MNEALYGIDGAGHLRELLRTDQSLIFGNASKKVKSFTALTGGLPIGDRWAFTDAGVIAARVVFSDRTTGVVRVVMP